MPNAAGLPGPDRSLILVVDLQKRLVPALSDPAFVVDRTIRLVKTAALLDVPVLATEHCADKIGPLVPEFDPLIPPLLRLPKKHFCAFDEAGVVEALAASGRDHLIVCGAEAHVCVGLTALGALTTGYRATVVADAVGSRRDADKATFLEHLRGQGVWVLPYETLVFDWLGSAESRMFKRVLTVISG